MSAITRRQAIQIGAFGLWFTLGDVLRAKQHASGSAKAAILVYLPGGPSHLDTFDPKPSAPREIRGEFDTIPTRTPGVRFCQYLPRLAAIQDKFTILSAVTGMSTEHSDVQVMTGFHLNTAEMEERPSIGAIVSRFRTSRGVPSFVSLRGNSAGCRPGFLGASHGPYLPGGQADADLKLPAGVNKDRFSQRLDLLSSLDQLRRYADTSVAMRGMDDFERQAFELIVSGKMRTALSTAREPAAGQQRYNGVEVFLKARRLIEAGVGCVTLSVGEWDTHENNFKRMQEALPELDLGLATLIEDLHDRGLDKEVVVLACGEFGRTPRINQNAGRDHWTPVMSAVLAGGGLPSGKVIGSTTAHGDQPKDNRVTVQQVLATICRSLDIDPRTPVANKSGRPVSLFDNYEPIEG